MKILIVVDMQNDFIEGALGTPEALAVVEPVVKRIGDSVNELIIFTLDTHQDDYLDTPEGKKLPVAHCIEGTWGWKVNEKVMESWRNNKNTIILPDYHENSFTKPVFGSVDLVEFLKSQEESIDEIEILGVCTDICVVSNAIMIKNTLPNIKISVNAKCCAGVTVDSHKEALNVMNMCQIDII